MKKQVKFFSLKRNGAWGGNNCFFESIGQTPSALEKIIEHFCPEKSSRKRPEGQAWPIYWPEGGKILRRAVLAKFEQDKDLSLVEEMCAKETNPPSKRESIVKKYKETIEYLPSWLHDYIHRKIPDLKICCLIQPDRHKKVLIAQAEINLQAIDSNTVFVLNRLGDREYSEIATQQMPSTAGYHYDGLILSQEAC